MYIAHVVRQYYPSIGGFEEVVKNLCKEQKKAGHIPYVVTLNRYFKSLDNILPETEMIEGIRVIRIPFIGSTRYPIAPSVVKHIKVADIVHVHAIDFFYDFLAFTKPYHRKKLIVTTHGGFFHTTYASTIKKVFFNTVSRASSFFYDKVIASSENDGVIFKKIVSSDKLVVIENGVDVEKLYVENKTSFPSTLLYFGRWSSNKGILKMLTFFKMLTLQDKKNQWYLLLAGRPYDLSEADLRSYIESKQISDYVTLINSPDLDELRSLSLKASYFISLSEFEGFGIAPIEAMSAGLTPVVSAIPPFVKLVNEVNEGVLIDSVDQSYADMLIRHFDTKRFEVKKMQNFVKKFAWKDVNQQYLSAYNG